MKKNTKHLDIDRDAKTKIINYIIKEYDKNYRKDFKNSEFTDEKALKEIIAELKELNYIKTKRNTFSIKLLGIRHMREILFNREQYITNVKIQWTGIILAMTLALISNVIAIYSFESIMMRISLILFEVILIYVTFKSIEKL